MDVNSLGSVVAGPVQSGVTAALPVSSSSNVPTPVAPAVVAPELTPSGEKKAPSLGDVQKAVDSINATLPSQSSGPSVQFAVDPSSKRVVVQVIDTQDGTVIRQIPSEEIIQMSLALGPKTGQVIKQEA